MRSDWRRTIEAGRVRAVLRLWAVLIASVTLAGCAGLPGLGSQAVPPEQRAAYDAAMGRLPADVQGAEAALEAFLETYPESRLADDAAEQLAQLALASGREEDAAGWLERILARYPRGDRAAAARLRLAQIEFGRDKRVAARRLLASLALEQLTLAEQRAALRLRVALAQTPADRLEHLAALRAVLLEEAERAPSAGSARARLTARLEQVDGELQELVRRATSKELDAMLGALGRRAPAAQVSLELVRRALDAGQLELAGERLDRAFGVLETPSDRFEYDRLVDRRLRAIEMADAQAELPPLKDLVGRPRPSVQDARGTIGVVLPLSGDFAEYGQASLRGILLAADVFAESDGVVLEGAYPDALGEAPLAEAFTRRKAVRLVVRDSRGEPARAAAQVEELAADPATVAVVGPIFSGESIAAADAAERFGLPLVSLSAREDVSQDRANAFRTRTTPRDEIGVLVGHAFDVLKAERFAVLYPKTRFGRGMRKLYWDAVTERGGKIVAASSYDPDAVDFASAIRDMIGYRFLTDRERRALDERAQILRGTRRLKPEQAAMLREAAYEMIGPEGDPLPPIVDFDVLFIPDAADKIALIAPGLAFHEIRDVTLLGSSDWVDDELLRVARRHVSGAVVSSPFDPNSQLPFVTEFVEGYRKTFDSEPDVYAAEAFDATNLVLVQLAAGRSGRDGVREGLLDTRAYPGATGVLTMHPNGNARRRPFLLRVSGRRFRPLD